MKPLLPQRWRSPLNNALRRISLVIFPLVLLLAVADYGFQLPGAGAGILHAAERYLLLGAVVLALLGIVAAPDPWQHLRRHMFNFLIVLGFISFFLIYSIPTLRDRLSPLLPFADARAFESAFLVILQIYVVIYLAIHTTRLIQHFASRQIQPARIAVLSFLVLIGAGTLGLMTPRASPTPLSFTDAAFTATSAVCVTGLSVFDVSQTLTLRGQALLLSLIQLGGLGILTIASFSVLFFGGTSGVRDRFLLRDLLGAEGLREARSALRRIIVLTFAIEAAGAALLFFAWRNLIPDPAHRLWTAVFHSVSAFCNAGFSNLPNGLAAPGFDRHLAGLSLAGLLVFLGAAGIPVLTDLFQLDRPRGLPVRWRVQTRLVFRWHLGLLVMGALLLAAVEQTRAYGPLRFGESLLHALFLSAMPRTAGFSNLDLATLQPLSIGLIVLLMAIGGAPVSTAGGIRLTTVAIIASYLRALVRGEPDVRIEGREIDPELCLRAVTAALVYLLTAVTASLALIALDSPPPQHALFEVVSALSTVGLSLNLTPSLSTPARWLLIACMFLGRLGILVVLWSLFHHPRTRRYSLPRENVVLS